MTTNLTETELDAARNEAHTQIQARLRLEQAVREQFEELVSEDELSIERANQCLEELGLDPITQEFTFTVEVTITGTATAGTESEVEEALANAYIELSSMDIDMDASETDVTSTDVQPA